MTYWFQCRDAWGNVAWPDGGPLLDQPAQLHRAFAIIAAEVRFWEKKDNPEG